MLKYFEFGNGGGLGKGDWLFVEKYLKEYKVRSVIEYGCGLSTELLNNMGLKVVSLETIPEWAEKCYKCGFDVRLCDYRAFPVMEHFDFAFIDGPGPRGCKLIKMSPERTKSVEHAMIHADILYMHDYNLKQFEVIEKNPDWEPIVHSVGVSRKNHLFKRIKIQGDMNASKGT
jgi:hypothetical protein